MTANSNIGDNTLHFTINNRKQYLLKFKENVGKNFNEAGSDEYTHQVEMFQNEGGENFNNFYELLTTQ